MKVSHIFAIAAIAVIGFTGVVLAEPGNGNANGNAGCTLANGDEFKNPGKMFQELRTRDYAASGNPKDIVDAYPGSFDSVGDLIDKKCGTPEAS